MIMMMMMMKKSCMLLAALASPALGQSSSEPAAPQAAASSGPWDPASRLAAQREAMQALAFLDGAWRGDAWAQEARGAIVHTERVGLLLDGTVRVVEGHSYGTSGETVFNAFGIISYDPVRRTYSIRSYAMGYAADFPLTVRPDGYSWNQSMGRGGTVRYTATISGDAWREVGERIADGAAPVRTFEMRLRRIGPTEWPQSGAVPPR
jgi:hypothetical protein